MRTSDFTDRELVRKGELEKPLHEMTEEEKEDQKLQSLLDKF